MVYSYTEKKRIRKDFGKRPQVLESATALANRCLTSRNVKSVA